MYLGYLTLITGLFLSLISEFYSIIGLMTIFSANPVPVAIMGVALGMGKLVATVWLKQNWKIAPLSIRVYLLTAISILMLITSLGIFGLLSKAHSDQTLVSGDVQSKIALYDEKIKTAKENIDANRRALKQMDEAVDQVMGRSTTETGADKAVAIRKSQQRERARLLSEIQAEQKIISKLNEEAAPIRAEIRKVEAEVGPIKYLAAFVYGETSGELLEKAVTWVIITLIIVFDPLAIILLLSSQISFQHVRKQKEESDSPKEAEPAVEVQQHVVTAQPVAEILPEAVVQIEEDVNPVSVDKVNALLAEAAQELEEQRTSDLDERFPEVNVVEVAKTYIPEKSILEQHPYLNQGFSHFQNLKPIVHHPEPEVKAFSGDDALNALINANILNKDGTLNNNYKVPVDSSDDYLDEPLFVQNEEQSASGLWSKTAKSISQTEYEQASIRRQDVTINEWIDRIKSGEIKMSDVPKHLIPDVRSRM